MKVSERIKVEILNIRSIAGRISYLSQLPTPWSNRLSQSLVIARLLDRELHEIWREAYHSTGDTQTEMDFENKGLSEIDGLMRSRPLIETKETKTTEYHHGS